MLLRHCLHSQSGVVRRSVCVQDFNKQILERADLGNQGQELIVSFPSLTLVVPRGKYKIEMYHP